MDETPNNKPKAGSVVDAKAQFEKATKRPPENDEQILKRLAALSDLDYERCRDAEAEKLGVRVSMLDKMVKAERYGGNEVTVVESLEPWHEAVDLNMVLTSLEGEITRYAILPTGAATAIALWIAGAYAINEFRIFPKLIVHSPEKRCGKSTVLDLVESFSPRALFASSISQAAIYRTIEAYQPTLIIDEADTFVANRNDEMIGIINSGHAKNRAFVVRSEGDNNTPTKFSTWAPMVLASIKQLQGTIMDRGVCVELRRKMNHETTQRVPANLAELHKAYRQMLARWSEDNKQAVRDNQMEPPHAGNDRAVDNWIPLFTMAYRAGGDWPSKVQTAYTLLTNQEEEPTPQIMLLSDIRTIFKTHKGEKIPSKELVDELLKLEERPWREWRKGNPMTQNSLAKLLGAFKINSKDIRYFSNVCKGYEKHAFGDAFNRYLPPDTDI
ncbi:DUF3631 domain-containing protein [Thiomicrorhabdus cannonii]|uniref:DUF3631 domain-containing protein n=1 Tax=Thiomicrorhabdus cannonii TaxID=2748011 RepID=UPI0015BCE68E|nr:DUF3631 domain-containing protein [Thiomicrorhabdus cannonii]